MQKARLNKVKQSWPEQKPRSRQLGSYSHEDSSVPDRGEGSMLGKERDIEERDVAGRTG